MEFKTTVKTPKFPFKINHSDELLSMGSCFSDEMGKRLKQAKFKITNNPFGVLFHPLSIENAIDRILNLTVYESFEIFRYNELFFSWDHSSVFSSISEKETLSKINQRLVDANEKIQKTKVIFITLATSWAYYLKNADLFVANCHKIPNNEFEKILLSENQIENSLKRIIDKLDDLPKPIQIVFTVSPVRHLRDGLIENNISKSRLLNAVYKKTQKHENVFYFPSYEILLDELRDYRFFAEDMIHPTKQAIDYIWDKFGESLFTDSTKQLIEKVMEIERVLQHKSRHIGTLSHKKFLYDSIKKIQLLEKEFERNTFSTELESIKSQLKNVD